MIIGIDISQVVYEGTGVARYVSRLTEALLSKDKTNQYVLFGSSFRKRRALRQFISNMKAVNPNVKEVIFPLPLRVLHILWNIIHVLPITWFIGSVDVFWSSDWTQPPLPKGVAGITTVHDLSFLLFPESFPKRIRWVQNVRMKQVIRTCKYILCDSQATKNDLVRLYGIEKIKATVVYPGALW